MAPLKVTCSSDTPAIVFDNVQVCVAQAFEVEVSAHVARSVPVADPSRSSRVVSAWVFTRSSTLPTPVSG